jgi:hypothetical protein
VADLTFSHFILLFIRETPEVPKLVSIVYSKKLANFQ